MRRGIMLENPFYVTPKGASQYVTEEEFATYHSGKAEGGRRVPRRIEREGVIEQHGSLPPGYSVEESNRQFHVYFEGKPTGKYGLDYRKACEIASRMSAGQVTRRAPKAADMARKNPRGPISSHSRKEAAGFTLPGSQIQEWVGSEAKYLFNLGLKFGKMGVESFKAGFDDALEGKPMETLDQFMTSVMMRSALVSVSDKQGSSSGQQRHPLALVGAMAEKAGSGIVRREQLVGPFGAYEKGVECGRLIRREKLPFNGTAQNRHLLVSMIEAGATATPGTEPRNNPRSRRNCW